MKTKKKLLWILAAAAVLLCVLFVPIPQSPYDDGGTRVYTALTYKIVDWNRLYADGVYQNTVLYGPADMHRSIDELWEMESAKFGKREIVYETVNPEQWLDKTTATRYEDNSFGDLVITEIYSDCFFASSVTPLPYQFKLNGTLSSEWCVGDQVSVTYENTYMDELNQRVEADLISVAPSDFVPDENVCYKPVIYFYPETETDVSVTLDYTGVLTSTYPAYKNGWSMTAYPDGTLYDPEMERSYYCLFWEGIDRDDVEYDFSEGFCIRGEDTAAFLEYALEALGLNEREANEFIIFWAPMMEQNAYNLIAFQTEAYTDHAVLNIEPAPDTLIRVFMAWHAVDTPVAVSPQTLTAPERNGFTVVEWGGTELS
ncbi:MAG: hypothetical protein ACI3XM_05745 [Eubacteriales bacterium]